MTDERHSTESAAPDDGLVSETYREMANESAPAHLDAAVLRQASQAARPRYSLIRAWTRPVAWAAVVMLSVGLLLEFSIPPVDHSALNAPAPASASVRPAAEAESEAGESLGSAALPRQERTRRDASDFMVQDSDMLQRAEDMARTQQGPIDEPAPALAEAVAESEDNFALSAKSAARSTMTLTDAEVACSDEARAEPESWLACIVELEQAGLAEIASRQREQLATAFPDFEQP